MNQAHITYKFKSQTKNGYITFTGEKIEGRVLKREIATKSGSKQEQLVLEDEQTRIRYKDDDFIKAYSVIIIERVNPSYMFTMNNNSVTNTPALKNPAVSIAGRQQLEQIINNAKFFMIKSSNEINIQRAKDLSLWATTLINQRKLKEAFQDNPNVILFFKASNSNNLQGMARMEEKPSEIPNKNVWSGVETIKLGGNFAIRWLSKTVVPGNKYEHQINPITKQYLSRSADSQEIERQLGKKIALMFEYGNQQDFSINNVSTVARKPQKTINSDEILNNTRNHPFIPLPPINPMLPHQLMNMVSQMHQVYMKNIELEKVKSEKEKEKEKKKQKQKQKERKKKNKKRDSSDDDSESSDSQSERSSERSRRKRKEKQSRKHKRSREREHKKKYRR